VRIVSDDERRARLALRHRLAPDARGDDVATVAGDICGLHATDPASVFLAARARLREPSVAAIEHALYDERSLLRMLGMRRTVFVVPVELAAIVQASSTRALVPVQRKLLVKHLHEAGVTGDGNAWLRAAQDDTLRALKLRGEAKAAELSQDVPALRERLALTPDKSYAANPAVGPRVLFLLAAEGRIVRGRPLGSWTSTLYRWAPMATWLPGGLGELETEDAAALLVERWLRAFGPGTYADLKWWTAWQAGLLKRALARVDPVEVALEGGAVGLLAPGDDQPVSAPAQPFASLLPTLDPAPMGWQARDWYLGAHRERLFDRSGNIGPTVWWGGRIVGGWAQRKQDGEVVFALLEDVGSDAAAAIATEAQRLRDWIGDVRVTPRFRSPLERELATGAGAAKGR
jgi:Winged helix DNA-binding domain